MPDHRSVFLATGSAEPRIDRYPHGSQRAAEARRAGGAFSEALVYERDCMNTRLQDCTNAEKICIDHDNLMAACCLPTYGELVDRNQLLVDQLLSVKNAIENGGLKRQSDWLKQISTTLANVKP